MHGIERRAFMKGAAIGTLAFTVGGAEVLLTLRAARAQGVPLRTLTAAQAATLDALGETLVPGARQARDVPLRRSADLDPGGGGVARSAHPQRAPALCEFLSRGAGRGRSRQP